MKCDCYYCHIKYNEKDCKDVKDTKFSFSFTCPEGHKIVWVKDPDDKTEQK